MPKDHLSELITALAHLTEVMANMGSNFKVERIVISDGKDGYHFDYMMRSSPSFVMAEMYPDARNSPQVREIYGVKIEALTKQRAR